MEVVITCKSRCYQIFSDNDLLFVSVSISLHSNVKSREIRIVAKVSKLPRITSHQHRRQWIKPFV